MNDFFSPLALTEKIQVGFADTNVFVDAERFGKVFDIAFGDFVLGNAGGLMGQQSWPGSNGLVELKYRTLIYAMRNL